MTQVGLYTDWGKIKFKVPLLLPMPTVLPGVNLAPPAGEKLKIIDAL
jgi:hypothetical protein